jgi:hypothetical protein
MTETAVAVRSWFPGRRSEAARTRSGPVRVHFERRRRQNPEFAKAVAYVQKYVAQARDLLDLDAQLTPLRTANTRERLEELTRRDVMSLSIDAAWELANELKRELLLVGDASYVWAQLEYEAARDKKTNKWHRWSDYFAPPKLRTLIAARAEGGSVTAAAHLDAVRSLMKLYELRAEAGLERRVRAAQKYRYLTALIPMLLVGLMLLSAGIYENGREGIWKAMWVAASAGALGATLSGTFRVRDRLVELDDLRSFWPAMRVQPLIGATAGLVTLFVLETGAVELGAKQTASWAALALFTFVAGFSEPFFLGLVQRVAVIPDKQPPSNR